MLAYFLIKQEESKVENLARSLSNFFFISFVSTTNPSCLRSSKVVCPTAHLPRQVQACLLISRSYLSTMHIFSSSLLPVGCELQVQSSGVSLYFQSLNDLCRFVSHHLPEFIIIRQHVSIRVLEVQPDIFSHLLYFFVSNESIPNLLKSVNKSLESVESGLRYGPFFALLFSRRDFFHYLFADFSCSSFFPLYYIRL